MLPHANIFFASWVLVLSSDDSFSHFTTLCQDIILGVGFSRKNKRNCPYFQRAYTLAAHEAKIIIFKWYLFHLWDHSLLHWVIIEHLSMLYTLFPGLVEYNSQ